MYFIKSKNSVNLECHILYVTASNFLCLIQDHKFQDYGPDYWQKNYYNNIINPLSWKINILLTALLYWNYKV